MRPLKEGMSCDFSPASFLGRAGNGTCWGTGDVSVLSQENIYGGYMEHKKYDYGECNKCGKLITNSYISSRSGEARYHVQCWIEMMEGLCEEKSLDSHTSSTECVSEPPSYSRFGGDPEC